MHPAEIEFLAEKERIDIIPNFSHGTMHLIQVLAANLLVFFLRSRRVVILLQQVTC